MNPQLRLALFWLSEAAAGVAHFGAVFCLWAYGLGHAEHTQLVPIGLVSLICSLLAWSWRWSMLPELSSMSAVPLTRLTAATAALSYAAAAAGSMLGILLWPDATVSAVAFGGAYLLAGLIALAMVVSAPHPSRDRDEAGAERSHRGFFQSVRVVWSNGETRFPLLALAGYVALGAGMLATTYSESAAIDPLGSAADLWVLFTVGATFGCGIAAIGTHRFRFLGLSVFGGLGLVIATLWLATAPESITGWGFLGFAGGWVGVAFLFDYLDNLLEPDRTHGFALLSAVVTLGAGGAAALAMSGRLPLVVQRWVLFLVVVLGFVVVVRRRLRAAVEVVACLLFWPMYKIRAVGPGVAVFPHRGPVLVIANHASWFDPLWLGKVIPRSLTPLMLSTFYDLPGLSWLMRRVVRAIRVQESHYRQHAPELNEAVARLDNGECVVIFPEAVLRRRDDLLVRRFAQGVWHIVRQRPDTPVIACWIEGGWGSYFSHRYGPPGQGKPFDWRRPITIVMSDPEPVPAPVLADQHATRNFLHDRVLAARAMLAPTEREEPATPAPDSATPEAETAHHEE